MKAVFNIDGSGDIHTTDGEIKLPTVTRVEVIDENGRAYVRADAIQMNPDAPHYRPPGPGVEVVLSFQDDGRTMKVFVRARA